jgi:hypothetical protein
VFIAFRRDRLTFPIIFATIFLPTWPWAAYMALRRTPRQAGITQPVPPKPHI